MNNTNADAEGYMVDKIKTKSEMLLELESIKGLLHEEDEIPILQEVIDQPRAANTQNNVPESVSSITETAAQTARRIYIEQQDFFNTTTPQHSANQLLDTIADLEEITATSAKMTHNATATPQTRPNTIKATGENPFLPEHIRSRLHGNNPPPLFEMQTARKIARTSRPTTQLGNTQHPQLTSKQSFSSQQELIDDLMDSLLPEIEKELRNRLEKMSKESLAKLLAHKN